MGKKTCLLVMPLHFYSFGRIIADGLEAMGYNVTSANDEYPQSPFGRVLAKLDLPVARWWTRRVFAERFLAAGRWDLIVIIKGRGIGPALVGDLKAKADRVVGYHFDALAYDRASERWGAAVDRVSTFDYRDAREKGWPVVELFSAQAPISPSPPIRYRISAIQRNHSDRLAYLDRVLGVLGTEDSFVFLFEKGVISLTVNALRNPKLYWKWRKHISFKPLPYDKYLAALAASDFTLDYAHPLQTGATMRCFEALAMGVKLITNNPHTVESPHFGPHNTVVHTLADSPGAIPAAVERLRGRRPPVVQRSPAQFLSEVIGEASPAALETDQAVGAGPASSQSRAYSVPS